MKSASLLLNHRFLLCLLLITGSVRAEALPDPTKPAEYESAETFVPEISEEVQEWVYPLDGLFSVDRTLKMEEVQEWKLTAIRITENDRSAVINGRIVRKGDMVGPARILAIQPVSVLLDHDSQKISVRLYSDLVQKKIRNDE